MISKQIVLVHGILNNGSVFSLMKKTFESNGYNCFVPVLKPSDGKYGLDDLAIKLKNEIDNKLGETAEFILVGFSMGGIVSRHYLQELDGIKRIKKFFSISTPHHGSYMAHLYPGKGTKQMRPNSSFLKNLEQKESVFNGIEIYSYRTPFDLSIIPSVSSHWKIAQNRKYYSLVHSLMLFNHNLIKNMLSVIKKDQ